MGGTQTTRIAIDSTPATPSRSGVPKLARSRWPQVWHRNGSPLPMLTAVCSSQIGVQKLQENSVTSK